ncbi:NACHT domain-containing protein [Streptomyces sp. NBC_01335]|uniref:NACHT domain-containing protein n=1 Tax=Streptomyces sp. NBC_01335 TaxID=2903828 RepID=UPI002E14DEAA|nr:NACHT domain-containing protein [Streptomyces sp. NBC_01335]
MERDAEEAGRTGDDTTRNEFAGTGGPVVMGRDIYGGVTIRTPAPSPAAQGDPDLARAADDLAAAVERQWRQEAALRRLNDPYPLSVRWRPTDPGLLEPWRLLVALATTGVGRAASAERSGWATGPEALSGDGGDLVSVLAKVPTGRLIVLGEPGSGKSVLLVRLVLDLLARRNPGEPVPVLLPLASWDPEQEDLDHWVEQRLGIDYQWLGENNRTGTSRGRELLDAGSIMLVMDGLDEIPDGVRGRAIARINDTLGFNPDLGMVLSTRSAPFAATVRPPNGREVRMTGAAGVTLEPLDLATVATYLKDSAGGPADEARWQGVFSTLAEGPGDQPLGQVLTTPLMAYLARVAYSSPSSAPAGRPDELLDLTRFPTRASIQAHLLDSYVPASYARRETAVPAGRHGQPRWWTTGEAVPFLSFLANDLEHRQQGTTDFGWWTLADAAPRILAGVAVGLVAVPAGVVMPFGAWLGVGMLVGVGVALIGRRWSLPTRSFNRGLAGGLAGSVLGSAAGLGMRYLLGIDSPAGYLVSGLALGLVPGFLGGFRAGLAGGVAASFVGAFVGEPEMGEPASLVNSIGFAVAAACVVTLGRSRMPARGLRWSPLGVLTGMGGGLVLGVAVTVQADARSGLLSGIVAAVGGSFGAGLEARPAEATVAAGPQTVLDQDRVTFWTTAMAGGLAIGVAAVLVIGSVMGPWRGMLVGVADGLATGLAWGFLQARYGSFTLARWWLALHGKVPLRLMPFLADAHRRGVLRQVGATYQLRHAELQRRLAGGE